MLDIPLMSLDLNAAPSIARQSRPKYATTRVQRQERRKNRISRKKAIASLTTVCCRLTQKEQTCIPKKRAHLNVMHVIYFNLCKLHVSAFLTRSMTANVRDYVLFANGFSAARKKAFYVCEFWTRCDFTVDDEKIKAAE